MQKLIHLPLQTIKRGREMRDDVPIDTPLHYFSETTRHTYRHWHK